MSKPSPLEDVRSWFATFGLHWTEDIETSLIKLGVDCVDDLKYVRKNEWLKLFMSSKYPIQRRLAEHVHERYLEGKFDPMRRKQMDFLAVRAKRQKLSPDTISLAPPVVHEGEIKIEHLPENILREVITYIPKTSRALLALALTTDSASWRDIHWNKSAPKSVLEWFRKGPASRMTKRPSAVTRLILSPKNAAEMNLWEEINFGDNEWELCTRLTDDDIAGMLVCINAVKNLKRLYITNCETITGQALEPLRGSTVLEQLDLSLAGKDHNDRLNECSLLEKDVLPSLDSIIDRENHSLRHLHFPYLWRSYESDYFARFLQRYKGTQYQQSISCQNCNMNCREHLSVWSDFEQRYFGIQGNTCHDCLNHYCYNCKDEEGQFYLSFCVVCEKFRCLNCMIMKQCGSCQQGAFFDEIQPFSYTERNRISFMCMDCDGGATLCLKCKECGRDVCSSCCDDVKSCSDCYSFGCRECMNMLRCEHEGRFDRCETRTCITCSNDEDQETLSVKTCHGCRKSLCFTHRLNKCKQNWETSCPECVMMIAPSLARECEDRNLTLKYRFRG